MSPFAGKIRRLVLGYKQILKRHLSTNAYTLKVETLQIKSRELKQASDPELFQVAHGMLYDVESWLAKQSIAAANEYSGLEEFLPHLKNTLRQYYLHGNSVINAEQHASRVIVESIQLLGKPCCETTTQQLKKNITLLRQLGRREELEKLHKALLVMTPNAPDRCLPLIEFIENDQHDNSH